MMTDLVPFLGRFHIVVLHLPIGLLAFALLQELYFGFRPRATRPGLASALWLAGTASAVVACVLGYLLSLSGDYEPAALARHLWWGLGTALAALAGWFVFGILRCRGRSWSVVFCGVQALALGMAGHHGGSLTHGPDFLFEHAPAPLRTLAGFPAAAAPRPQPDSLEAADIFADVVHPILQDRCATCHQPTKLKGGLLLASHADILRGGDSGPSVVPGRPDDSELLRRVTLDPHDEEFMPAGRKPPLRTEQINAIAWWIEKGAPAGGDIGGFQPADSIREVLALVLGLKSLPPPPRWILPDVAPPEESAIARLEALGFDVKFVGEEIGYLDIDYYPVDDNPVPAEAWKALGEVRDHVAWLNLSRAGLTDADLAHLAGFPNLLRLNLARNEVTSEGLLRLAGLERLESLNLHGTLVDDRILPLARHFPRIKHVYLWDTRVTPPAQAETPDPATPPAAVPGAATASNSPATP